MFFIINQTRNEVIISDLKLRLGPRQAMDLDKIVDRRRSERSKDLSLAIKKGIIKVRQKTPEETTLVIQQDALKKIDECQLKKMKKELSKEFKDQIGELKELLKKERKENINFDTKDLLGKISELIKERKIEKEEAKKILEEEDVQLDEEKLTEIHARTVNKIIEGIEMEGISYEEKKVEDDLNENIEELEDLLR